MKKDFKLNAEREREAIGFEERFGITAREELEEKEKVLSIKKKRA